MLPPSYIDYILSKGLADGVAIAGCRFGECQYRLGPDWSEDRFEGRRDPHLRKRVPRERLLRLWVAPTEWKDALHGLEAFQAGLNTAMPSSGLQELADEAASNVRVSGADEVKS